MKRIKFFSKINIRETRHFLFIQRVIRTEQISVLEAIKYFLSFWKLIIYSGIFFLIIGFVQNLLPSNFEYTSEAILLSDQGNPSSIDFDNEIVDFIAPSIQQSSGNLGIETFPVVLDYYPFLLSLLEEKILSERLGGYVSLEDYLNEINKPTKTEIILGKLRGLPSRFITLFQNKDTNSEPTANNIVLDTLNEISQSKLGLMDYLLDQMEIKNTAKGLSIITKMPEAKVSTRFNNLLLEKLVEEIIKLKTARQIRNLNLIQKQYESAKLNFESTQKELALYRDENKGNNSAYALSKLDRINSEYSLHYNLYSTLASKYELAKIELIENTPFFEVVEPAFVPFENESGFKIVFSFKYFIFGIFFSLLVIIFYTAFLIINLLSQKVGEINL